MKYGEEGEGEIRFPDDFLAKDLAGKTVTIVGYPRKDGTAEIRAERIIVDGRTIELR